MSLDVAILSLPGTVDLEVTRRTGAYDEDTGVWVPDDPPTVFTVKANIQDGGRIMSRGREGQRTEQRLELFVSGSSTPLRPSKMGTSEMADTFTWGGATYEVDSAEDWGIHGYQQVYASKRET